MIFYAHKVVFVHCSWGIGLINGKFSIKTEVWEFSIKTVSASLYQRCFGVVNSTVVSFGTYMRCVCMGRIYGYCRVSTQGQNIERQVRNILSIYADAHIVREVYTGTRFQGRKELDKLLSHITSEDTIVFDSVSRMSRNADEGVDMYMKLYDMGVRLIFLKEPHIDTDTYRYALSNKVELTGDDVDDILTGVNNYLKKLAKKQIALAFEQSEKEVMDLRQRTKEGIETARLNGKQIGGIKGKTFRTKKSKSSKERILELSKDFRGTLNDADVIKVVGVSRNTYYKYKRELVSECISNVI